MLQDIREKAQGWIAWVIVILISIPFALWGINSYFGNGASVPVLEVNGQEVSRGDFQQAVQQRRRQLQALLGDNFNTVNDEMIQNSVIDGMVRNRLLLQVADEGGMRIGDAALAQRIHSTAEFRDQNGFSKSLYESRLLGGGYSPASYEADLRASMLMEQLQKGIGATDFTTPAELDTYLRLREQQRTTGYLEIATARFDAETEVTDEEVKKYFDEHKDEFITPEQVRVNYLELTTDALAAQVSVSDADARAYYDEHPERYGTEEQRRAAHILIPADPTDDAAVAAARAKAEDLLTQIRAGADFAALAKANSEDPGSAEKGGDLGFFGRGLMDPAFDEAAFALQPGEVSEPVQTSYGIHLIKLLDLKAGDVKPYDQVAEQVKTELRRQKVEAQLYEKAETLANLTFEHPDSLEPAAEALGIPTKTSDWFGREGGSGVADNQRVAETAFADDVLNAGANSEVLELGKNRYMVLRVEEHRTPTPKSLDEVSGEIRHTLKSQKTQQLARELGDKLAASLRDGADPAALAEQEKVTWHPPVDLKREDTLMPSAIARTAFTLPKPADGSRSVAGAVLPGGDYAVVMVTAVKEGVASKVSGAQQRAFATTLARGRGQNDFEAFGETLRAGADVVIHRDNL